MGSNKAKDDIRLLRRSDINAGKWDAAVKADASPRPYGLSWWLDAATNGDWQGLVVGNYSVVLPLPRLRRFRIMPALLRPPFTQQLGPFGAIDEDPATARRILRRIPKSLQISLPLRASLTSADIPQRFQRRRRTNFVLDLSRAEKDIVARFPKRMRTYYRRYAEDRLVRYPPEELLAISKRELGGRGGIRDFHWQRLSAIIEAARARDYGECYGLHQPETGELLSVAFYPRMAGRIYNLSAASTDLGRADRGMERMFFCLIRRHAANVGMALDFEGSELPGVREFFAKFGGQDEGYWTIEEKLWGLAR